MLKRPAMLLLDSGIGGLSILLSLRAVRPDLSIFYLADTGYAPYGDKSPVQLKARGQKLIDWLLTQFPQPSVVVVACNTLTVSAITDLRQLYPTLALVGVEPGLKPAVLHPYKKIALLATAATINSAYLRQKIADYQQQGVQILPLAGVGLVDGIEAEGIDAPSVQKLLTGYIDKVLDFSADVLVLGCTHYSFLTPAIKKLAPALPIIDTSDRVAAQALTLWEQAKQKDSDLNHITIATTGDRATLQHTLATLGDILPPHDLTAVSL